jgi:serine/threonine protein kinase
MRRGGGANKLTVAVKCLHHEGELNHQAFVDIVNEVSAMCNLNHPNLIKLHGIVFNSTSTTNNTGGMVMMVTELAPHGSLYAYLRKFKLEKKYPLLNQIYSFIYQIGTKKKFKYNF